MRKARRWIGFLLGIAATVIGGLTGNVGFTYFGMGMTLLWSAEMRDA